MRVNGEWYECDDALVRPVVRSEILAGSGFWEPVLFLVDTGADRTVFSAAMLDILDLGPAKAGERLGGIGGIVESVSVATRIRLPLDDGGKVVLRGEYAAFTKLEALDMSVLGRDVLGMFAVIVDQPAGRVALVAQRHRYAIHCG